MSVEAVKWAMDEAPMLLTEKGKPDTTARHVLQVLAEHAHKDGGGARPSILRLQYRTGYDRRTCQRALRRLEDGDLIRSEGVVNGCTTYRLALHRKRPASDMAELEAEEARQREADAERQRRSRARRVTHSNDVTVTHSASVTADVGHALSVPTSRTLRPDVTDGTPPEPSIEPSGTISLASPAPDNPSATAEQVERETEPLIQKLMDQHQATEAEATAIVARVRAEGRIGNLIGWASSRAGALDFQQRLAELRQRALPGPRPSMVTGDTSRRDTECRSCDRPIKPGTPDRLCRECAAQAA